MVEKWTHDVDANRLMAPKQVYVPVTPADSDLADGVCDALLVGTAGAANLMQPDGTVRTGVPLQAGYNPIRAIQVRTGTAASGIWALYVDTPKGS